MLRLGAPSREAEKGARSPTGGMFMKVPLSLVRLNRLIQMKGHKE